MNDANYEYQNRIKGAIAVLSALGFTPSDVFFAQQALSVKDSVGEVGEDITTESAIELCAEAELEEPRDTIINYWESVTEQAKLLGLVEGDAP